MNTNGNNEISPNEKNMEKPSDKSSKRKKSFWGGVEQAQTTIEDFGYHVKTEIRKSENVVIYIASNEADETVAIKKISIPYSESNAHDARIDLENRIRQEMELLSKIGSDMSDRFVITYYDYRIVDSCNMTYDLYIRMDYLTSVQQIYDEKDLCVSDLLNIGIDICESLEWCHEHHRIHNNLNLNNIFIDNQGRYVLGDVAFFDNQKNDMDYYIAPELFRGAQPSPKTDIYALGMALFVLLNKGLPPFADSASPEDITSAIKRLRSGERPALLNVNQRLFEVIQKALAPVDERYATVKELKNDMLFLQKSMPQEWKSIFLHSHFEPETVSEEAEQDTALEVDSLQSSPKELAPEEVVLKKKNLKDYILFFSIIIVLVAGIISGVFLFGQSGNQKAYSMIEAGTYASAFKEIQAIYNNGKNVDALVKRYVDVCANIGEYKRVLQAVPLLSDETYSDSDYYKDIILKMKGAGKDTIAGSLMEMLKGKSEEIDQMLNSIK